METLYRTDKIEGIPDLSSRVRKRPENTGITELTLHLDPDTKEIVAGQCTRFYDSDHIAHMNSYVK